MTTKMDNNDEVDNSDELNEGTMSKSSSVCVCVCPCLTIFVYLCASFCLFSCLSVGLSVKSR